MKALKLVFVAILSSFMGFIAGGLVVVSAITVVNYRAVDGPYFPAPLVAPLLVVPVTLVLLFVQGAVVAFELIAGKPVGNALLPLGLVVGVGAGLGLYAVLVAPYEPHDTTLLCLAAYGAYQGSLTFWGHWIAYRVGVVR